MSRYETPCNKCTLLHAHLTVILDDSISAGLSIRLKLRWKVTIPAVGMNVHCALLCISVTLKCGLHWCMGTLEKKPEIDNLKMCCPPFDC